MKPTDAFPEEQRGYVEETKAHITTVRDWLDAAVDNLVGRRRVHDASKLEDPEIAGFMALADDVRLNETVYGSPEYRAALRDHKWVIHHHYAGNDHHPEFYGAAGIAGMSLMAILEMLCDWKASTERMKDGDLQRSIEINADRFGYDEMMTSILLKTARELGMLDD